MNTPNRPDVGEALRALPRWSDNPDDMAPDPDGPWLRYSDVEALLARLSPPAPGGDAVPLLHRLSMVTDAATLHVIGDFADKAMAEWVADNLLPSDRQWVKYVIHTMHDTTATPAPTVEREAVGWYDPEHGDFSRVERIGWKPLTWLTTPPAEAREPVGDADEETPSALRAQVIFWRTLAQEERKRNAQPRDTPRDSVDAVLRAANKLAAAAMTPTTTPAPMTHEGATVVGCTFTDTERNLLQQLETERTRADALAAEVEALRSLAATCYAGLGAECDLPERWLDVLVAASEGKPFDDEALLPFRSTQAARIAELEAGIWQCAAKAARYDYLRENAREIAFHGPQGVCVFTDLEYPSEDRDDLDRQIDVARSLIGHKEGNGDG